MHKIFILLVLVFSCQLYIGIDISPEKNIEYVFITQSQYDFICTQTTFRDFHYYQDLIYVDYDYLPIMVFHLQEFTDSCYSVKYWDGFNWVQVKSICT